MLAVPVFLDTLSATPGHHWVLLTSTHPSEAQPGQGSMNFLCLSLLQGGACRTRACIRARMQLSCALRVLLWLSQSLVGSECVCLQEMRAHGLDL